MNAQSAPATGSNEASPSIDAGRRQLTVTVGTPDFEHGRIRLALDDTGAVTVRSEVADNEKSAEGRIEVDEAGAILRSVAPVVSEVRHDRPGTPDEARYTIELIDGGRTIVSEALWEGQIEGSPAGRKLIEALRRIVLDVAGEGVVF